MAAIAPRLLFHLRRLADPTSPDRIGDAGLLERFLSTRDEASFAVLVRRHGPMVLRVCRRLLGDVHAAEDAFQATFLVLARKAASIKPRAALAGWLYGVARRVALKAQADDARRRRHEVPEAFLSPADPRADPLTQLSARELLAALEKEIQGLREVYRVPVVLCCLEGLSQEEAAQRLSWTPGSVRGRLERGRKLLRDRLAKRGLTLPAALAAVEVSRGAAGEPAALAATTLRVALADPAGTGGAAVALAQGVMSGTTLGKFKAALLVMLILGAGALGTGLLAPRPGEPGQGGKTSAPKTAREPSGPATDFYGDPLPPGAVARLGTLRLRHGDRIRGVGFLPGGKALLSADWHGVRAWDAATGKPLHGFGDPRGRQFQSVAFSGDGRVAALTLSDGDIDVWDAQTGKLLRSFRAGRLPNAALSRDGTKLALLDADANDQQSLSLWDPATGKELCRLHGHQDRIHDFHFSRDGKTLISAGDDKTIRFWDVATGKQLRQLDHTEPIGHLAVSPDGKTLATVGTKKTAGDDFILWRATDSVSLWDADAGKVTHLLRGHSPQVLALAFAPDGKTLVSSDAGVVYWWDVATGKELPGRRVAARWVGMLAFAPDGKTLLTGGSDCTVLLWDVATGKELLPGGGHHGSVLAVAVSADGRSLATGGSDALIRLWDARTGRELCRFSGDEKGIQSLAFLRGGNLLSGGFDATLRAWDAAAGEELRRFPGACRALSPDGRVLATSGPDKVIRLWDVAAGTQLRQWPAAGDGVRVPAFSADGKGVLTWGEDKVVRVWDAATGKQLRHFSAPRFVEDKENRVYCCAFSPDGKLAAFGGQVSYVVLYDVRTGKEVKRLAGSPGAVSALAFSPDGRTLATAGEDKRIHLWEVATGAERLTLEGHAGWVQQLLFAERGRTLISASNDTTALVWDLSGWRQTKAAPKQRLGRADLEALWADLKSPDAAKAGRAVWSLVAAPRDAVAFLGEKLRPARPADPDQILQRLADLHSERFAVRAKAEQALANWEELAEPYLRKELAKRPPVEVRRRVEKLLDPLEKVLLTGERLRVERALEVLEYVGNAEARRLLRGLAGGAPQARLTREAQATLKRLPEQAATP